MSGRINVAKKVEKIEEQSWKETRGREDKAIIVQ